MGKHVPKVSVIIPSYNHERFVGDAITSVLSQGYQDFELIIADDCSTDKSQSVIESYNDLRIQAYYLSENIGPCEILKFLIEHARGKYIALLNSDDLWDNGKLEKQVSFMETHPEYGACFTWGDYVDTNLKPLTKEQFCHADVFLAENRRKEEWFHYFFHVTNCICHPSMLIKKEVYDKLGYYNPAFRQLPDFDYWVRLVQHYEIYIIPEKLTHLRWHLSGDVENTSAATLENQARAKNESIYFFYDAICNMDNEFFRRTFSSEMRDPNAQGEIEFKCEKYFLLSNGIWWKDESKIMAINYFYRFLSNQDCIQTLKKKYNYPLSKFFQFAQEYGTGGESLRHCRQLQQKSTALQILEQKQTEMVAGFSEKEAELQQLRIENAAHLQELSDVHTQLQKYALYIDKLNRSFPFRVYHVIKSFFKKQ